MSQLADIVNVFKQFRTAYKWTRVETVKNFVEVTGALEWELNDSIIAPVDWQLRKKLELEAAWEFFSDTD